MDAKLFAFLSLLLFFSPSLAQNERPSLVDFYNSLEGPNWVNQTNWLTQIDHCEWFGVICYGDVFRVVVGLRLPLNNLIGKLPPNFFDKLPYFFGLDLSSNVIGGPIDDSICRAKYLQYVDLSLNFFEGSVPDCWSPESKVVYFQLRYNRLTGTFPQTAGNMNLTLFDISENFVEGPIAESICKVNKTLEYFFVVDNQLNGSLPECLSSFQKIFYFYLDANKFTGQIPADILKINYMDTFSASRNSFTGYIPDVFSVNQSLRVFWLGYNDLTGRLPLSLVNLLSLQEFKCDYNRLEGPIPPNYSQYVNLTSIVLASNKFSGPVPPFPTVKFLSLRNNSFNGTVDFLKQMASVQFLDLSYNNFSGQVPHNFIYNSTEISHISLNNNDFSGPLFDLQAFRLAPVTFIDVSYNRFSGQIGLAFLPELTSFKINNNQMQGYIYLFASDFLTVLDYSNNQFIGRIPTIIGFVTSLEIFRVDNNRLVGGIPSRMVELKQLTTFTCSGNRLNARDISVITQITSLEVVDFSKNLLNCTLPDSMGALKNLKYFDVSNNLMRGRVPDGLFTLPSLSIINFAKNGFEGTFSSLRGSASLIDLSDNNFEGEVGWISSLTAIQTLNIRNNRFSGQVQDMSPNKQCSILDLSNNQLSGDFPEISQLTKLVFMNVSFNQFQGRAPQLDGSEFLHTLDLSHNQLIDASRLSFLPSLTTCSMSSNSFECPVTWQAFQNCSATCQVTPSGSSTLRLRVKGDLNSFDSENFKFQVSSVGNFTQSRMKILKLSSGSVISDLEIAPPSPGSVNEGSSKRIIEILMQSEKGKFQQVGLEVLSITAIPQDQESTGLSKGAIAGIVVALVVVFGILISIMIFLIIRGKRRIVTNQFAMIDVSTINLGAAKKSIIKYDELSEMSKIGSGAFGIVYRAKWRELDVAVKQIRAEFVSEEQLKNFLSEVAILQGLRSHPNVVLFMAVTFPPDPLSMITEICEGGGLYEYLRVAETVTMEQKMLFLVGICKGMIHLHHEGIIHRDLAARNVLLSKHLEPKVADFGLSRENNTGTAAVTVAEVGPLKWMSPESIQNRQYSTKSDVFSFGVVVWEVLEVMDPFSDMLPVEVALKIVNDGYRLNISPDTSIQLSKLMSQCWAADPEERPTFTEIYGLLEPNSKLEREDATSIAPVYHSMLEGSTNVQPKEYSEFHQ